MDWQSLPTTDGNVPGPVFKVLSTDADSGGSTILIHLPPGWRDEVLDWHPCSEEGLVLGGTVTLADRRYTPGVYLYRPPGILHGPAAVPGDDGVTIVQRFSSELRILRYTGDEFPHRDLQPVTRQHETGRSNGSTARSRGAPVVEGGRRAVGGRSIQVAGPGSARRSRRLDPARAAGGRRGEPYEARGEIEEFVLEGTLDADGERFERWGYASRPRGSAAGGLATAKGASLICWWEMNELDDRERGDP